MLEFVIEAMVDAVVVVNSDGRIILANAGAEQLTAYSRDELRAMHVTKLFSDDSSGMRTVVRRRIEEGGVLRREESWIVTKNGEQIPVSVTGSPVLDGSGLLHGIVLVARDVREMRQLLVDKEAEIARRKQAEDDLRAAKESIETKLDEARRQLLLAERRATLGTLAGGVGHELRNIAQIQVAAVDELAAAIRGNEDVAKITRQLLPDLERVGEHITEHGHRLLELARPGPDHVAPLDLNDVVRDVAQMLEHAGKLGHRRLVLSLSGAPVTITVNRTRIEQILVNLIINAVDATDRNGTVTVTVLPNDDGDHVTCSVHDTGSGIPSEILGKIFEPFYTTKGEAGTGLGLPVVREIVASYGGSLTVVSSPGKGTTFTFDLPR